TTINIPVFIRDTSGTPLGIDQPPGSRIQSYSIKVDYAPGSAVQSITFTRAGINAPLPGNQVANLQVNISASATPGVITLTLDPLLTQLANQAGTTTETVTNGRLLLVSGAITITQRGGAPTLSMWGLILLAV